MVVPGWSARVVLLPAVPELQHQPVRFACNRPVRASVKHIEVRQHNRAGRYHEPLRPVRPPQLRHSFSVRDNQQCVRYEKLQKLNQQLDGADDTHS